MCSAAKNHNGMNFSVAKYKILNRAICFFMKPEKIVEVCPVCGSADLYYEAGGYTGKIYHCKNCDYMGALIVEADEEMAAAIKDDYEHKKQAV
jgi:hypothetical protein